MSTSPNIPFPLPLRQTVLHDRAERLGLVLGAARERAFQAGFLSAPDENSVNAAIDREQSEAGSPSGALTTFNLPRRTRKFQFNADLFRDDTLARAVIMNTLLILTATAILIFMYS